MLLGPADKILARAKGLGVTLDGIEILDPEDLEEKREAYAQELYQFRQRKGVTLAEARDRMRIPLHFGYMMVREGDADALVAGEEMYYPETLRPGLQTIGTAEGVNRVAGLYMMVLERELIFFSDTTVNIEPDAETLAEIALLSANFVEWLGMEPRVAMLSFSNFGSVAHAESLHVRRAVELVKARHPDLMIDGEMQVEMAMSPDQRAEFYPFSSLKGEANVLIFPDLNSANMGYKLLATLGGAEPIGPVLLGMAKPVQVLQRGSTAADILHLTAIAVVDAQERKNTPLGGGRP